MSLINLTVQHGRTFDDARARLQMTVDEVRQKFGMMIQRVDWAADRNSVKLFGTGFELELRVDAQAIHLTGDIPLIGWLLATPLLQGLKGVLERTFQKRLPE